ncbi:MAG: hypothetical protein FD189_1052 [Elusimicrobia bacterium]|nr:MAG: hypothetical protein FD189_1052 [Elusimicrobiota bacterium]
MSLHSVGIFDAEILDHGFSKSRKVKTDQFVVNFQTPEGKITGFFAMTDSAIEYTIEKIRAMGFEGADLGLLADGTALRGAKCQIVVKHEVWLVEKGGDGQTRAKVDGVWPLGYEPGIQRDEAAVANVKRFNALLKKCPPTRHVAGDPPRDGRKPSDVSRDAAAQAGGVDEFDQQMAEDSRPGDEDIPF